MFWIKSTDNALAKQGPNLIKFPNDNLVVWLNLIKLFSNEIEEYFHQIKLTILIPNKKYHTKQVIV
jgi:hypothetical protein